MTDEINEWLRLALVENKATLTAPRRLYDVQSKLFNVHPHTHYSPMHMQGYSNFRMVGVDERINNEYEKRYAHIYVGPANSKGKKTYYV